MKNLYKLILPLTLSIIPLNSKNFTDKKDIKKYFYINTIKKFSKDIDEINYVFQPKSFPLDYFQNPSETKKTLEGNCVDKAIFLNDTLKKLGLCVYLVYGLRKKGSEYSHVWQQFEIGKDTFIIESSKKLGIYKKDKILALNLGYSYKPHSQKVYIDYLNRKITDYQKRNKIRLNFKQSPNQ